MSAAPLAVAALGSRVGDEIGVSAWIAVTQARIDAFANATDDHQFIHVNPERAAREGGFSGTIAHGFLTLSLLSVMSRDILPNQPGTMHVNYGLDTVRFLSPVRAGAQVRGRFLLDAIEPRGDAAWLTRWSVTVEVENEARPALVAGWRVLTTASV